MKKFYALLNVVSVLLVLGVNYYSVLEGINGNTVGSLSSRYDNLFTPASYAFSIWGIIFLSLIIYVVYQSFVAFKGIKDIVAYAETGYWFALVNLANALWVFVWLYEITWLSILVMLFMLFGLLRIVILTNMERWDAPLKTIAFIWWPICIYSGWIAVATIANFSAYFSKIGWEGGFPSEVQWTIIMILVATIVNLFMIWKRNMREFALVGVWALVAIYSRHQESQSSIAIIAISCAIFLSIIIALHGYRNRSTSPIAKLIN